MKNIISRRSFLKGAALAPFAARMAWADFKVSGASRLMFVGTQTGPDSKGIYSYHWDPATGDLKLIGLAAQTDNPTFLALGPGARRLYAANEINYFDGTKNGAVSGFNVDHATGMLKHINSVNATGPGTTNVTIDRTGQAVICANYTGGSAASFHADKDGRLSEAVSQFHYHGHGPNAERQEAPHAHRATVSPDNRYAFINDLGLDCIHIYKLDAATAKMTPSDPAQWNAQPGSGPRALRFHPNGRWAYCVTEMGSTVVLLDWNPAKGTLTTVQQTSVIPADYHGQSTASEIVIDRTGRFAYVADRFYDHLMAYAISPADGKLTLIARTSCGGKVPRHIALDPTERWVLVANQESDNIAVIRRDPKTGRLAETGNSFPRIKPQCLLFA